jgi:hypothetical protein
VAKGREIGDILLRVEESIGVHGPSEQTRTVPVICGIEDWEESDGASVADNFPQQSSVAVMFGIGARRLDFTVDSRPA